MTSWTPINKKIFKASLVFKHLWISMDSVLACGQHVSLYYLLTKFKEEQKILGVKIFIGSKMLKPVQQQQPDPLKPIEIMLAVTPRMKVGQPHLKSHLHYCRQGGQQLGLQCHWKWIPRSFPLLCLQVTLQSSIISRFFQVKVHNAMIDHKESLRSSTGSRWR